jgi:hypothetical protein
MGAVSVRLKKLGLDSYDCLSPALMDAIAIHTAKAAGVLSFSAANHFTVNQKNVGVIRQTNRSLHQVGPRYVSCVSVFLVEHSFYCWYEQGNGLDRSVRSYTFKVCLDF